MQVANSLKLSETATVVVAHATQSGGAGDQAEDVSARDMEGKPIAVCDERSLSGSLFSMLTFSSRPLADPQKEFQ